MIKIFIFSLFLFPLSSLGQYTINGRILNQADTKPVANTSIFLSNTTIGAKTDEKGVFTLRSVKPGKYELVVSIVGFETLNQTVTVESNNLNLADITIFPKTIALTGVSIKFHADPNREKYYNWFKDEFLGTSYLAQQCRILNPNVLDLNYDEDAHKLTALSDDFLQIENDGLGYLVKYQVTDFSMDDKDSSKKKVYYKGPVLFEQLKGRRSDELRWQRNREEVYANSAMHFLRAALSDRLDGEGFRVQGVIYANPERPSDSLIDAKIKLYKDLKPLTRAERDSLSYWIKKSKLPALLKTLLPASLSKKDLIKETVKPGQYTLGYKYDALLVGYSSKHRFHLNDKFEYLYNPGNKENTLIEFNSPEAFFDNNGVILNPYSVIFYGVWGRNRVADLLPLNYEPPQSAVAPGENMAASISGKLEAFDTTRITEKAYLHFDKSYYAAGDTMYFKAYVTAGEKHELSNLSGVLHVDLIDTDNKIDQSIKLQLINGLAWGDFALPDSLLKGDYRVRAYTQWMRNDGDDAYFDQTIPVGSIIKNRIPENAIQQSKVVNAKPDVQFFPEGGDLVTGIRSKVAFKATGANGLGIDVKGEVLDNKNQAVATFSSVHLGMGYFYLNPAEGESYKARIVYPDGSVDVVDLPKSQPKGIVLSVNNDSIPVAAVRIGANKAYYLENRGKEFELVVLSGGTATTLPCALDSTPITLNILKRHLQTGVATVTLFSPEGEPLCERLFFVQNYDQLNMNLSSDKTTYAKREKVNIKLDVKDRAGSASMGNFSVSVTDESKVPVDENDEHTILTNLLLTSDLKGYVEQPNYYFRNITDKKTSGDLDLVMLTHGYRRFEWKKLLNNGYPPITYQAEKEIAIAGMAKNGFGKPLVNGTVTLIPPSGGSLLMQQTDDKGNFNFSNLAFTDSAKFILQAVNAKGQNSTTIVYNKEKTGSAVIPACVLQYDTLNRPKATYMENSLKQYDQVVQDGRASGLMLKEVKIRQSKKHIIDTDYRSSSLLGPGHADQVVRRKEIENMGGLLADRLNGKLRGIVFENGVPILLGQGPMQIVVDGVPLMPIIKGPKSSTPPNVNYLNSNDIETVEVLKGANASIYGMEAGNGVLVITTRQGGQDPKDIQALGILPITVNGFYKAREFYSPKYDHPNDSLKPPDLRSTIYWQPELVTDKDGNASIDYYNADGTGTYRIVIEGIDSKGNLGRQVYRYQVE